MISIKKVIVVGSLIGLFFLVNHCQSFIAEKVYLNHSDSVSYVGMQSCRSCHSDIYESYTNTGMGHSFGMALRQRSDATFGDEDIVYDSVMNLYYKPYWDVDTMKILEYRLFQGDTIHKRNETIKYIIGSGHHTNSHLVDINSYITQAPITYYTQKKQWGLAPGFKDGFNSRFQRVIGVECMTCHNAYSDHDNESINKYDEVAMGIDCERCHGPGQVHVERKLAGEFIDTANQIDYSIVNPAKLSIDLQNSLCQRCHLQGVAVLAEDKSFFDFKPGQHLSEVMKVFMPDYGKNGQFIMASHVERLNKSKCFIESEKISCITCHNPHKSVKETKRKVFNNVCSSCHGSDLKHIELVSDTGDCVSCHMPSSGSVDIPHVAITDHNIGLPDKNKDSEDRFQGLKCISDDHFSQLELAQAYLSFYDKFQADSSYLDTVQNIIARAEDVDKDWTSVKLHLLFNKQDWNKLIELAPYFNESSSAWDYYRLGEAYYHERNWKQAIVAFKHAASKKELALDFRLKLGSAYFQNIDYQNAIKEFEFIVKQNPKHIKGVYNLASCYLVLQKSGVAKELFNRVIKLDPDHELAWRNLLSLLNRNSEEFKTYQALYLKNKKAFGKEK